MAFFEDVYNIVKQIPVGKVATYGQIAHIMGQPRKAKIVGWALHGNPYKGVVPCHRVVDRNGKLSGAFVFGGPAIQKELLENEGIIFDSKDIIDLQKFLWKPE
jgi:methylated-DNA-protein-cysteine methyltransferase-like protein